MAHNYYAILQLLYIAWNENSRFLFNLILLATSLKLCTSLKVASLEQKHSDHNIPGDLKIQVHVGVVCIHMPMLIERQKVGK